MSLSIDEIYKLLFNAVDKDGNVMKMDNVLHAVSLLENFPMTKEKLEKTRIGKLVNEIRRKASDDYRGSELKRRLRSIIHEWKVLLQDSFIVIVPNKDKSDRINTAPINGSQATHASVGKSCLNDVDACVSKEVIVHTADQRTQNISDTNVVNPHVKTAEDSRNRRKPTAPPISNSLVSSSHTPNNLSAHTLADHPVVNREQSDVVHMPDQHNASSFRGSSKSFGNILSASPSCTSKVQSTAELLSDFSGIPLASKSKILNNEVTQEIDEEPSILPEAIRSKRRNKKRDASSQNLMCNSPESLKKTKSEIISKYLESSANFKGQQGDPNAFYTPTDSATSLVIKLPRLLKTTPSNDACDAHCSVVPTPMSDIQSDSNGATHLNGGMRRANSSKSLMESVINWNSLDYTIPSVLSADCTQLCKREDEEWHGVNGHLVSGRFYRWTETAAEDMPEAADATADRPTAGNIYFPWINLSSFRRFRIDDVSDDPTQTNSNIDIW